MADPLRPEVRRLDQPGLLGELQAEVSTEATPLLGFVLRNAGMLATLLVVMVLAFGAAGIWHWYAAKTDREAQIALGRILIGPAGQERINALDSMLKDAPPSIKTGIQLEIAVSAIAINDFTRAAQAYGAVYSADPKGTLGLMAALNQIDTLQRANTYPEALKVIDALLKTAPADILPSIRATEANCAEQAGNLNRALAGYEALVAESTDPDGMAFYQAKIAELRAEIATKS